MSGVRVGGWWWGSLRCSGLAKGSLMSVKQNTLPFLRNCRRLDWWDMIPLSASPSTSCSSSQQQARLPSHRQSNQLCWKAIGNVSSAATTVTLQGFVASRPLVPTRGQRASEPKPNQKQPCPPTRNRCSYIKLCFVSKRQSQKLSDAEKQVLLYYIAFCI